MAEGPDESGEATARRRPIAARGHPLSRWAARRLAAAGVSANAISLAGLAAAVAAGLLLALLAPVVPAAWIAAALLIELRLLCNMLDGMVAEARGESSRLGALYNEVPDRFADIAVLIGLGYAPGGVAWIGYAGALAAVMTAYVNAFGQAQGAPPDYGGPLAKPQRMQLAALAAALCFLLPLAGVEVLDWGETGGDAWGLPAAALALIALGSLATVLRRLARLARRLA